MKRLGNVHLVPEYSKLFRINDMAICSQGFQNARSSMVFGNEFNQYVIDLVRRETKQSATFTTNDNLILRWRIHSFPEDENHEMFIEGYRDFSFEAFGLLSVDGSEKNASCTHAYSVDCDNEALLSCGSSNSTYEVKNVTVTCSDTSARPVSGITNEYEFCDWRDIQYKHVEEFRKKFETEEETSE